MRLYCTKGGIARDTGQRDDYRFIRIIKCISHRRNGDASLGDSVGIVGGQRSRSTYRYRRCYTRRQGLVVGDGG